MPYEPYYLANKRVPRYDTSFLGYGNDKTGQCYELWRAGIAYKVCVCVFGERKRERAREREKERKGERERDG